MFVDSFLNGRTQFVRCGENESSVGRVTCGVPQGSVLGPLLFVSYFNEVLRVIKYSRFHNSR
jgi:ribonucleases P/MRP protein subunit RPP40